eukprot:GHVS01089325.1.p2 GENE.GHVS01089325.1~~GHVS01089325.1.p2  ORF type:complete len:162 (+),score=16.04 GHVS01089325.1:1297-1782(+)
MKASGLPNNPAEPNGVDPDARQLPNNSKGLYMQYVNKMDLLKNTPFYTTTTPKSGSDRTVVGKKLILDASFNFMSYTCFVQLISDESGPRNIFCQFIPLIAKTEDEPLSAEQKEFFENFDQNLEKMAKTCNGTVRNSAEMSTFIDQRVGKRRGRRGKGMSG